MPFIVIDKEPKNKAAAVETVAETVGDLEMVGRNCDLKDNSEIVLKNIKSFEIQSEMIAYASPDSTYAVTKQLFDSAKKSVLIGIYDFTATYMRDILLNLMARGVKVSLMLDIDGKAEFDLFKKLADLGATCVEAPSCASKVAKYFSSSHEKVIVIDNEWVMVQSGNFSNNSIPLNEKDGGDPSNFVKGNRDVGIAINSPDLAKFFTKVLRGDMKLETDEEGPEAVVEVPPELPMLVEAAPKKIPEKLFKSKRFVPTKPIKVTPILSPDNYMTEVPDFLKTATKSIYIEQQYIRSSQSDIVRLLDAIKEAVDSNGIDVSIILGKLFSQSDVQNERANLKNMATKYGLKLGTNIRFINTDRFVHCHNKLIVIDDKRVLVSSQNWSNSAVSKNREAGLILEYPALAKYYSAIFASDWDSAFKTLPTPAGGATESIELAEVKKGGYIEVAPGDYAEV